MLKLGLMLGYSGKQIALPMDIIHQAEALGFDSAWTAEAYGSDAVTTATWVLAQTKKINVGTCIMQVPARTPANAAMTAMSLDQLSGGRFRCGLGASGPQVVEGWHGMPYGNALTRVREYIEIVKKIMAREEKVQYDGKMYQMPYTGEGALGLGKPLKSILQATDSVPIYTASITPGGLRTAAEVADGVFPVFMSPEKYSVIQKPLEEGFAKAGNGKSLKDFDIAPAVPVMVHDDVNVCIDAFRDYIALYVGGMGAKGKNFYFNYVSSMGYADACSEIQDLYLAGKKEDAAKAVPFELIDEISLLGPKERIMERAQAWKDAGARGEVGSMLFATGDASILPVLAEALL